MGVDTNNGDNGEQGNVKTKSGTKLLLLEGLKIMVMDLVIEGATLITVYLALMKDSATGYQLTSLIYPSTV